MITAIMFDLDGTLIQSEKLKAFSYASAVQQLRQLSEPDPRAIKAYRGIVGSARDVASRHIVDSLGGRLAPPHCPVSRIRALGRANRHSDKDLRRDGG